MNTFRSARARAFRTLPRGAGCPSCPPGLFCAPFADDAACLKRWQPQIRANAQGRAATTGGIVIDVHARLGYAGVPMDTTDEDRIRHLTHLTVALSPQHAARLFDAQEQGANEGRLREFAAEALKKIHFQDGGRRAGSLQEVQINDVLYLDFEL